MASQQLQEIIEMLSQRASARQQAPPTLEERRSGLDEMLCKFQELDGVATMTTNAGVDPMIQRDGLVEMAKIYLGDADPRTPLAAPLYGDLAGLPPLLIQVCTAETLLDDSTRITERAQKSGVDVVLEPWEDMTHAWHILAPMLPEGQQAIDRIGEYVRERIGTSVASA